jgi:uncharacterized damage-inducible protein DinB
MEDSMKSIITALAVYNQGANKALCEIIAKVNEEILKKDCGTFYHSVLSTIHHYLSYEISWLKRYRSFGTQIALNNSILDGDLDSILSRTKNSVHETQSVLLTLDTIYVDLIHEMTDKDLEGAVTFTNPRGETIEKNYWKTVFHVLNHSTHHRGEISAMLDISGISNDYAGFFRYL